VKFLSDLKADGYQVIILSTKEPDGVIAWLKANGMFDLVDDVTDKKVPAVAYVDDRAVRFTGNFAEAFRAIRHEPHWRMKTLADEIHNDEEQTPLEIIPVPPRYVFACSGCHVRINIMDPEGTFQGEPPNCPKCGKPTVRMLGES
jgi:hypothetical protein